jgi:hypothetical protein
MKVEQNNIPKFEPVTITIESQLELDIITSLIGSTTPPEISKMKDDNLNFSMTHYNTNKVEVAVRDMYSLLEPLYNIKYIK